MATGTDQGFRVATGWGPDSPTDAAPPASRPTTVYQTPPRGQLLTI